MHRILLILAITLALWPVAAHAHRFGPPWQARVSVDRTVVYTQPDAASPAVGPLERGQIVVVIGETKAETNTEWSQIPDGYVRSGDIVEDVLPWIAEVTQPSVSIAARPNSKEPIRRTARQGDLLRVTGASLGIDGDTSIWWATTEGYISLSSVRAATSEWATNWILPNADLAANGWWGAIRTQANVRTTATTNGPVVGTLNPGDRVKVLA